jgi:hypothetical protein
MAENRPSALEVLTGKTVSVDVHRSAVELAKIEGEEKGYEKGLEIGRAQVIKEMLDEGGLSDLINLFEELAKKYKTRGVIGLSIMNTDDFLGFSEENKMDLMLIDHIRRSFKHFKGLRMLGWTAKDSFQTLRFNSKIFNSFTYIKEGEAVRCTTPAVLDNDGLVISRGVVEKIS